MSAEIDSQSLQKKRLTVKEAMGSPTQRCWLGSSPASTEQAGGFSLDGTEKRMPQLGQLD